MSLVPAGPAVSTVDSIAGPIVVRRTRDEIWITLPTASAGNRAFFRHLAINVATGSAEEIRHLFATIIRRESYFRAVLIQSRGRTAVRCPSKCGNANASPKFRHCVRLPPYQNGACAECVWQSRGAQCSHHHAGNVPPAGSDGGSSHGGSHHGGSHHGGSQHGGSQHGGSQHGGSQYGGSQHGGRALGSAGMPIYLE
ncbi:hypothetical protein MCOR02_011949 [Pyricularia oryzae]|nr:hypothetical protein MCOR02_011949 [Pyricularia oryzae]KAI6264763.1 hypothetical protein MCOR34_011878 [Pyricularia oryzae]KAI6547365.1 hypothetical protein MCOR04_011737 [Pyricularia oryzae]KAI6617998.1 hypothetical protein MCOR14_010726 [Pyricularia oryzae]